MNKRRLLLGSVSLLLVITIGFGVKMLVDRKTYQEQIQEITISEADLSKVPDGTYEGSYETLWVSATVKVTVEDHKITQIQLIQHDHGRGTTAEVIPEKVVLLQSLKVDAVSGATSSSMVILKAIEKAIQSAVKGS